MRSILTRTLFVAQLLSVCAFAGNSVVNLSHYDLVRPDFVAMKNEGMIGLIHEATYPRAARDEKYAERQKAAVRAGLLWGAYHFADATDPVRQADFFLNAVSSGWRAADASARPEEVLLVLDFERNGHYPGGTMRVDQAVTFAERIRERTGVYPGIYSGEYRIRDVLNNRTVSPASKRALTRCWLWVANYHYEPQTVSPWSRWTFWQYTGDGVCDLPRSSFPKQIANVRNAERNIFRGSDETLRAFWQTHGWNPGGATNSEE